MGYGGEVVKGLSPEMTMREIEAKFGQPITTDDFVTYSGTYLIENYRVTIAYNRKDTKDLDEIANIVTLQSATGH